MSLAQVELEGIGKATSCQLAREHRPVPLRFVWHHILPQACGGKTEAGNLAQVCDSCHYSVHILMWYMANGGIPEGVKGSKAQRALAQQGYSAAVGAGTAGKIPKEASSVSLSVQRGMAREKRGGKIPGSRAGRGKGQEPKKSGRKVEGRYTLTEKQAKTAEDTPCIARGNHGPDCICGGTGVIKTKK